MKTVLFISNITSTINSFSSSAINAAKENGMKFIHVANWGGADSKKRKELEKEYGITIINVSIDRSPMSLSNIRAYKQICEIIRKYDIDYIHCNTPVGGVLGRLAGKKCKVKKVLYQAHGFHFYKGAPKKNWLIYYTIEKFLARFTDCIVTMNAEDNAAAKRFKRRNNGPVYNVHGVGIDLSMYEGLEQYRDSKRQEFGFTDSDIVLISMGDLILRKNYAVAIDAVAKCDNPKLHYIICGKGPELDNLKQRAKDLGVEQQIHFLGFRSDIKELLAAADIFIFTSLQEGMPRSMMEAMAAGLPCIASKIRGNVDLIENGKGGYLCDPRNENEFANAIQRCLLEDISSFGKYNKTVVEQYDISVVQEEIGCIYKSIQ